jgi:hypothetical protein
MRPSPGSGGEFPGAVGEFFAGVLVLCGRLGTGRLGVVALDGMKIAAPASKSANRTEAGLRKLAEAAVAAHAAADAAEDELFGAGRRGDEVPEAPRSRDERIRAALADLEAERKAAEQAEQAKAEAFRDRQRAGQRTGRSPAPAAVELAQENLARVRAARAARLAELEERRGAGKPRRGRAAGVDDYCRVKEAAAAVEAAAARAAAAERKAAEREDSRKGRGPVRNTTGPDSRLMPGACQMVCVHDPLDRQGVHR